MSIKLVSLDIGAWKLILSPGDGPVYFNSNADLKYVKAGYARPAPTAIGVFVPAGTNVSSPEILPQGEYLWALLQDTAIGFPIVSIYDGASPTGTSIVTLNQYLPYSLPDATVWNQNTPIYVKNTPFSPGGFQFSNGIGFHSVELGKIKAKLDAWYSMPFTARSIKLARGGTSFFPKLDFSNAVRVNGANAAAVNAAITAIGGLTNRSTLNPKILLCNTDINKSDNVITIPANTIFITTNASKITGGGTIYMSDNSIMVGFDVTASVIGPGNSPSTSASGFLLLGNRFTTSSGLGALNDGIATGATRHMWNSVILNEFVDCQYGTVIKKFCKSKFKYNKFKAAPGSGRALYFEGGLDNNISYNIIEGHAAGIICLLDRVVTIGFDRNYIGKNFISGVTEEAMSIDAYGNSDSKGSVVDRVMVSGVGGTYAISPTVTVLRNTITDIAIGMHIIPLQGTYVGKPYKIISVNTVDSTHIILGLDNYAMDATAFAALTGVYMSVQWIGKHNIYDSNVMDNVGTPFTAYGCGIENLICNNVATRSTQPVSPPGLPPETSYESRSLVGINGPTATSIAGIGGCVAVSARNMFYNNDGDNKVKISARLYNPAIASIMQNYLEPTPIFAGNNFAAVTVETYGNIVGNAACGVVTEEGVATDLGVMYANEYTDIVGGDAEGNLVPIDSGTFTASGTGSQTVFNIPHALGTNPRTRKVIANSAAAAGSFFVSSDKVQIIVTYTVAPVSAANNVVLEWEAKL